MPTTKQEISICLFELPDKDQAVIQRVITLNKIDSCTTYGFFNNNLLFAITFDHFAGCVIATRSIHKELIAECFIF